MTALADVIQWNAWFEQRGDVLLYQLDPRDTYRLQQITDPFFVRNWPEYDTIVVADGSENKDVHPKRLGFGAVVHQRELDKTFFFAGELTPVPARANVQTVEYLPLLTALEHADANDSLALLTDQQFLPKCLKNTAVPPNPDVVVPRATKTTSNAYGWEAYGHIYRPTAPTDIHIEWVKSKNGNRPHTVCDVLARLTTGVDLYDHFDPRINSRDKTTKSLADRATLAEWTKEARAKKWDGILKRSNKDKDIKKWAFSKNANNVPTGLDMKP